MTKDIRIAFSFLDHRKRRKLRQLLGPGSTDYLLNLWLSTAMNHPDGVLGGMDEGDVALEAHWDGDANTFVQAMLDAGFLDKTDNGYALHDWREHQGFVIHAHERQEKARKAADARWHKKNAATCNADGNASNQSQNAVSNAQEQTGNAGGNASSVLSNAPSPIPSPSPIPNPVPNPIPSPNPSLSTGHEREGHEREQAAKSAKGPRQGQRQAKADTAPPICNQQPAKAGTVLPGEESDGSRLASKMYNLLTAKMEFANPPDQRQWAKVFADMLDCKRYGDFESLSQLVEWACADHFWSDIIVCPEKLFKHYDQLVRKMQGDLSGGKSSAERRVTGNKVACAEAERLLFGEVANG